MCSLQLLMNRGISQYGTNLELKYCYTASELQLFEMFNIVNTIL